MTVYTDHSDIVRDDDLTHKNDLHLRTLGTEQMPTSAGNVVVALCVRNVYFTFSSSSTKVDTAVDTTVIDRMMQRSVRDYSLYRMSALESIQLLNLEGYLNHLTKTSVRLPTFCCCSTDWMLFQFIFRYRHLL